MFLSRASACLLIALLGLASPVGFWASPAPVCHCQGDGFCPMCHGLHRDGARGKCGCSIHPNDTPANAPTAQPRPPPPALAVALARRQRRRPPRALATAVLRSRVWNDRCPPRPPPRALS